MTTFRALTRVLLVCDLRDPATLIFTFLVPPALLVVLVLTIGRAVDAVNEVGANVLAFGTAFVGIYAGATHLAEWRANGMIRVLRSAPVSRGAVLGSQAAVGVGFALAQALLLVLVGSLPWLGMSVTVSAALAAPAVVLGYLVFFFLGVLLANWVPSMSAVSMLTTIVIMLLGFAGGAMMPLESLPGWVQAISPLTPLYHLRELISHPLIHVGDWPATWWAVVYLCVTSAGLYALVRSVMRWT